MSSSSSSRARDEDSISPPTYRVEEDEIGELINPDLKVKFPERPKKGRYSLANYLRSKNRASKRRGRHVKQMCIGSANLDPTMEKPHRDRSSASSTSSYAPHSNSCRCTCGQCCRHSQSRSHRSSRHQRKSSDKEHVKVPPEISREALSMDHKQRKALRKLIQSDAREHAIAVTAKQLTEKSTNSLRTPATDWSGWEDSPPLKPKSASLSISENLKRTIVGPQTVKAIEEMLLPTQFLLYYRRPHSIRSIDDVPLYEPLTIAYKSSTSEAFHYRMRHSTHPSGEKIWHVDLGPDMPEQPSFYSLSRLIQYYKVFAFSANQGNNIEFF